MVPSMNARCSSTLASGPVPPSLRAAANSATTATPMTLHRRASSRRRAVSRPRSSSPPHCCAARAFPSPVLVRKRRPEPAQVPASGNGRNEEQGRCVPAFYAPSNIPAVERHSCPRALAQPKKSGPRSLPSAGGFQGSMYRQVWLSKVQPHGQPGPGRCAAPCVIGRRLVTGATGGSAAAAPKAHADGSGTGRTRSGATGSRVDMASPRSRRWRAAASCVRPPPTCIVLAEAEARLKMV